MIIVTGATGQLGSRIVDRLLSLMPADQVGVSVRDAGKAAGLAARGVRVRRADFSDPDSLSVAFEGASQVLVISSNDSGAHAVAQHRAAFDAARDAGAERVLYTSHQASGADSSFAPMIDHAATEQHLIELGGRFTSLRNGFYASTVPLLIGEAVRTGTLFAPADGPVSWTAHADLAEVAAIAIADEGRLDGVTPPLTAGELLDLADVAAVLTDLTGRRIARVVVDDEEWLADMVGRGMPPAQATFSLGMYLAARRGEFSVTDPTLEGLLGRPAIPLATILESAVAARTAVAGR